MGNIFEDAGEAATPYIDWVIDHWYYAFALVGVVIVWYILKLLAILK
jgi:hypothetical protein